MRGSAFILLLVLYAATVRLVLVGAADLVHEANVHFRRGNEHVGTGALAEAKREYEQALALYPAHWSALQNIGLVAAMQRDWDAARDADLRALAHNNVPSEIAKIYSNLGVAYWELGQFEMALDAQWRALTYDPNSINVYVNLGMLLKARPGLRKVLAGDGWALGEVVQARCRQLTHDADLADGASSNSTLAASARSKPPPRQQQQPQQQQQQRVSSTRPAMCEALKTRLTVAIAKSEAQVRAARAGNIDDMSADTGTGSDSAPGSGSTKNSSAALIMHSACHPGGGVGSHWQVCPDLCGTCNIAHAHYLHAALTQHWRDRDRDQKHDPDRAGGDGSGDRGDASLGDAPIWQWSYEQFFEVARRMYAARNTELANGSPAHSTSREAGAAIRVHERGETSRAGRGGGGGGGGPDNQRGQTSLRLIDPQAWAVERDVRVVFINPDTSGREYGHAMPHATHSQAVAAEAAGEVATDGSAGTGAQLRWEAAPATHPRYQNLHYRERSVFLAALPHATVSGVWGVLIVPEQRAAAAHNPTNPADSAIRILLRSSDLVPPFSHLFDGALPELRTMAQAQPPPHEPRRVKALLSLVQRWGENFYHWISECVGRLALLAEMHRQAMTEEHAARDAGGRGTGRTPQPLPTSAEYDARRVLYDKRVFVLLPPRSAFIMEALAVFGLTRISPDVASDPKCRQHGLGNECATHEHETRLLHSSEATLLRADVLFTVEWAAAPEDRRPGLETSPPQMALQATRRAFHAHITGLPDTTRRRPTLLFLSRNKDGFQESAAKLGTGKRMLRNEPEVIHALRAVAQEARLEFVVFHGSSMSLVEAARLFSRSAVVVGVHGAALSNIVFCPQGAAVVEVTMKEPCFRDYTHATQALGLSYFVLDDLPLNSYHARVHVDPKRLAALTREAVRVSSIYI